MPFDPSNYGAEVANILTFGASGARPMPLAIRGCTSAEAARLLGAASARSLFPGAFAPEAALSGLWLYFGCFEESHAISQDIATPEGSYWHGILHRQEPDPGNAGYWFRRVGRHPIFPALRHAAAETGATVAAPFRIRSEWDPFAFIEFCEQARQVPGSIEEQCAKAVQLIEWQLLFDHCARPGEGGAGKRSG